MAYDFNKSNGTPVSVADGAIDTSQFSIGLVGKNVSGYGLTIAQTYVHMLEHFANNAQPSNPTTGQIWYDSTGSVLSLKVYDGTAWRRILSQDSTNVYVFDNDVTINGDLTIAGDLLPDADCDMAGNYDIGAPSLRFCTVYAITFDGTATAAEYSDLAERYEADQAYTPGTIVKIGGDKEVTQTTKECDEDSFGVVSTAPGLMMNSKAGEDETHPFIALFGRVHVRVTGEVEKGNRIVSSSTPGVGQVMQSGGLPSPYVIGRALESKSDAQEGLVLCAVRAVV